MLLNGIAQPRQTCTTFVFWSHIIVSNFLLSGVYYSGSRTNPLWMLLFYLLGGRGRHRDGLLHTQSELTRRPRSRVAFAFLLPPPSPTCSLSSTNTLFTCGCGRHRVTPSPILGVSLCSPFRLILIQTYFLSRAGSSRVAGLGTFG